MMNRIWNDESGVLTFEWILLITLLVIGIVGGIAVIRDAYIIEAAETADAMLALNHSYVIQNPVEAKIDAAGTGVVGVGAGENAKWSYAASTAQGSKYQDKAGTVNVTSPGSGATGTAGAALTLTNGWEETSSNP